MCDKNRYLRELSLVSMTKIGIRVKASLVHFGKFGKLGKFRKCKLDHLIHIKYVFHS